ncbi:16S rRNA (uracil(1498)-N(3))-methyltransferase [Candidatus Parcubacteria bacterium]|jgi:16S rRNA (uracil1498-N3)-methyltransferase|nr:MAG: 16S rRNA (uracil(1498)-N(3))-methyltransferase [Candidatus Parcubacteria bacterium]
MKKIHRFIGDFDISQDSIVITDKELVNQICVVLKLAVNERICISDGKGNEADARIREFKKNEIIIDILTRFCNIKEPKNDVSLFLAILKNENFDLVVQKASEIGIKKIIPMITERTIKQNINRERTQKIVKEAAELSGRAYVPEIHQIMKFDDAIQYAKEISESTYFFDSTGKNINTEKIIGERISLFIGPEGGWGDEERILASDMGFPFISLGDLTFRGETAAIIASYLACKQR